MMMILLLLGLVICITAISVVLFVKSSVPCTPKCSTSSCGLSNTCGGVCDCPTGQSCNTTTHTCGGSGPGPSPSPHQSDGLCVFDIDGTLATNNQVGDKDSLFTPCLKKNYRVAISTMGGYQNMADVCNHTGLRQQLPPMLCKSNPPSTDFIFMHPTNKGEAMYKTCIDNNINPNNAILFDDSPSNLIAVENANKAHNVHMKYACSGTACAKAGYPHSSPNGLLNSEWVTTNI